MALDAKKVCRALALLVLAASVGSACDTAKPEPPVPPEVRVGFVFGDESGAQLDAVRMALGRLEEQMEGDAPSIVPVYRSTDGTPESARATFTDLVEKEGVHAIIGPTWSSEARAAHPVAQEASVPVLAVSNSAGGITDVGEYIFRVSASEGEVIVETVERAREELDLERVSLVYASDDAFSKAGAEVFRAELRRQGTQITGEHPFASGARDFAAILEEVATESPDGVVISALQEDAWEALRTLRQSGSSAYVIGGSVFSSAEMLEGHKAVTDNMVFGVAWHPLAGNEDMEFVEIYHAAYGREPDALAAQAYAGVYILHSALGRVGLQGKSIEEARNAIRDALRSGGTLQTVLGPFSFTDKRNPDYEPSVMVVRDGRVKELR